MALALAGGSGLAVPSDGQQHGIVCPRLGNGAGSSAGKLRIRSRVSPGDTHVLKLDNPINTGAGSSDPSGRYHFNFAA